MDEYGFMFKCAKCGKELKDGDDLIIKSTGMMSGNTPVILTSRYTHLDCGTIWATGFDSYD